MRFRQTIQSWRNPDLVVRFRAVSLLVDSLDRRPEVDPAAREQAKVWLADARGLLQQRVLGILPYDRYDAAWAVINQLRHLLCAVLRPSELLALLADIRGSTAYLSGRRREACERDLSRIEQALLAEPALDCPLIEEAESSNRIESLSRLRLQLENLSRLAAGVREAHWRKVNLLRKRLAVTSWTLLLLLGAAFGWLPEMLTPRGLDCPLPYDCSPVPAISRLQLGGIMLFGAIGGLVSALWTHETINASSSRFYLQRTLLMLKPIVGAAMATFTILLEQAGIVSVLPSMPSEAAGMAAWLVLAFLSGFSERFVRTRIEAASSPAAAAGAGMAEAEAKDSRGE